MNKCEVCNEVMKPGLSYWGDYCPTRKCWNSELVRLYRGPRYQREKIAG